VDFFLASFLAFAGILLIRNYLNLIHWFIGGGGILGGSGIFLGK
jgi:hypothetical protein